MNEPTTSRCDRSGTVPERVRLALWCERATGPVPEPFQLPVTFVDSQPILHISKRSSLHGRSGTGVNTGARLRSGTVPVPNVWCEHGL